MSSDFPPNAGRAPVVPAVRVAWIVFVGSLLLFAGLAVPARLAHLSRSPYGMESGLAELGIPLTLFAWYALGLELLVMAVCLAVATVVAWNRSRDWFALLVAGTLALASVLMPLPDSYLQLRPALGPGIILLRYLGFAGLLATVFLFPDGRFVPRWMRWLFAGTLAIVALGVARDPTLFLDTAVFASQRPAETAWLILPALPAFLAAVGAQVYRYRHATPLLQQQIKWVFFGFAALCGAFAVSGLTLTLLPSLDLGPESRLLLTLAGIPLTLFAILLLPLSLALAVLRAGLWEIDLIINRAAVYTLLTASLTGLYFGLTVLLQAAFQTFTGEASSLAIVISTLAIAFLFAPLRKRLQEGIDRRFYRRKYDAVRMLARFSQRAQAEVDLEALTAEVVDLLEESMQPAHVSLWLRQK